MFTQSPVLKPPHSSQVPELKMLRGAHTHTTALDTLTAASMQLEVFASFTIYKYATTMFGVDVLAALDGSSAVSLVVDCTSPGADADCHVIVDATAQGGGRSQGPLLFGTGPSSVMNVTMHAIVDHSIIELIVNNRTAMVTYNKKIPSASSTSVALWGTSAGVKADIKTWSLDAANNLGPQP